MAKDFLSLFFIIFHMILLWFFLQFWFIFRHIFFCRLNNFFSCGFSNNFCFNFFCFSSCRLIVSLNRLILHFSGLSFSLLFCSPCFGFRSLGFSFFLLLAATSSAAFSCLDSGV